MNEPVDIVTPSSRYEIEVFPEDSWDDDGTMTESAKTLQNAVVGHRIISAEKRYFSEKYSWESGERLVLSLDNQTEVVLREEGDCCAYTSVDIFKLIDTQHVITSVGTNEGFQKWYIYAENNPVFEMDVSWSCGNPFYYGYGFSIQVVPLTIVVDAPESRPVSKEINSSERV